MRVPDYKIHGRWATAKRVNGSVYHTVSYSKWTSMVKRCKAVGKKDRTYADCEVGEYFSGYQRFAEWHVHQIGYDTEGYHLDKDLLVAGNRIYTPDVCVLIPHELNAFLLDSAASRGSAPRGVHFNKAHNKYRAYITIGGEQTHLGYSEEVDEAYEVYVKAKEKEALRWHSRLTSGEYVVDPRVIERLASWRLHG